MILEAKNISKKYATHQALKNVSISIPRQSVFGLLGPNGAGKTSLIRTITQIISLDEGEIIFNGEPLQLRHTNQIGYLPEERGLYKKMKVAEQLMYLAQLKGLSNADAKERIKKWFDKLEMASWWNKNIEDLSKGMQQKVQFVATVIHEPTLLILDEPFSGFDPVNADLIKNEILELKQKGTTILFSTHRMESVEELCDYVALIHKSEKILDGKTKEVKQRFKTNTFKIQFKGELQPSTLFEVIDTEYLDTDTQELTVKLRNQITPNQLLAELIGQVEIQSFQENIPSMNDIFIKLVTENPVDSKNSISSTI
jgi:ABC-2 type transport system ATP-binding protein